MRIVTETYGLTEERLPTIPVPHDCEIREITLSDGWLVLSFEEEIARRDAVRCIHPNANTLRMRIHLTEEDFELYAYERRRYECVYVRRKPKKLLELARRECALQYLNHFAAYGAMRIELFQESGSLAVELRADRVLLEWLIDDENSRKPH